MEIYLTVIFGLVGLAIGSFINVCIDRLPAEKSLISPPSHCDNCQRRLSALDLIPIFSYLWLRGRCRYCGAKIPLQVLLVELGCGIFLALLFWFEGFTADFGLIAFYSYIFLVIGLIDLRHQVVLSVVIFPALALALIFDAFVAERSFYNSLAAAGVGAGIILIPVLITRGRGMGFGDVEIAALIGLSVGFTEVIVGVLGGIILGGIAAIILVVFRIKKRKDVMAFGPFLAMGAVITLLWGSGILQWYLNIFSR